MRAVDVITVYLASAAPVGVWHFLRPTGRTRRLSRLAPAAAAALLWPLYLSSLLLTRGRLARRIKTMTSKNSPAADGRAPFDARAAEIERNLLGALHRLEDAARDACGDDAAPTADAARDACATVERFAGLTLAAARADAKGEPAESELETARAAGRTGDDLEIAGRCVRRRNAARLEAHRRTARVELLHALADLPDTFAPSLLARPSDFGASRRLYAALLPVYTSAIELLSLFADARGVQTLARLFDRAAARLRQLEALAADAVTARAGRTGDEPCTPHSSQSNTPRHRALSPSASERPTLTRA